MKYLLRDAIYEIRELRHRNEILAAKVEVMDLFALVLNTQPNHRSVGMSPDVIFSMEKRIMEIEEEEKRNKTDGCC